jgi:hypothetical protein
MAHAPTDHRPLLDPLQMEEAGRALRRMLVRLKAQRPAPKPASDDIAWEDGEPHEDEQSRYG